MWIQDWNGREVEAARSRGGVLALADFSDNLVRDDSHPWPPPAITQKLYQSRQVSAFSDYARQIVTRRLGYYSDIQSINSEDAITWSYFGTLANATDVVRTRFLNWLLMRFELSWDSSSCSIDLWRRVPHPDTLVLGGPELDFALVGNHCVAFGEAKWRSGEGRGQGVLRGKGQLQLRCEFLAKYGARIYGSRHFIVLYLVTDDVDSAGISTYFAGMAIRTLRWSDLCEFLEHPRAGEFRRYYDWKLHYSNKPPQVGQLI